MIYRSTADLQLFGSLFPILSFLTKNLACFLSKSIFPPPLIFPEKNHPDPLLQLSLSPGNISLVLLTHTVVTDAAMRGPGRPEDLACITVFQLHNLVVYLEILDTRGWSLALGYCTIGSFCRSVKTVNTTASHYLRPKALPPLQEQWE